MNNLHDLLDAQSHLVMHPLMGLYIAAPFTTNIPIINYKWKSLLDLRKKLWGFLQTQVDVIINLVELSTCSGTQKKI